MKVGYAELETVHFQVPVAGIRDKLTRVPVGTSLVAKSNPPSEIFRYTRNQPRNTSPFTPSSVGGNADSSDYYYWTVYGLEVEFKGGLMTTPYELKESRNSP